MLLSDIALSVRGLSKSYSLGTDKEKHSTLAESLLAKARSPFRRAPQKRFLALNDVSFEINMGEVVGIIGRNGAGKSTLLKILSRITEPTSGQIDLYGRVGALLEVGTGFHPELTGRENIFLNGAILGMQRHEIARQFDAIVAFAEIDKFLDTPVKRYSSGMYIRLAFGVAAHLNPEILLVDEVLAVGDMRFQQKCLGKLRDVSTAGRTVFFVSHDMRTIRNLCSRVLYLKKGQILVDGPPSEAVAAYLDDAESNQQQFPVVTDALSVNGFDILQDGGRRTHLDGAIDFQIRVEFALPRDLNSFRIGVYIQSPFGDVISRSFVPDWRPELETLSAGAYTATLNVPGNLLMPGSYRILLHASCFAIEDYLAQYGLHHDVIITPPVDYNRAHPGEAVNAIILISNRWNLERT